MALNAGWDEEMLRIVLAALKEVDFNLDLMGFAEAELARLLAEQEALVGLTGAAAGDPAESPRIDLVFRFWQCDKKKSRLA